MAVVVQPCFRIEVLTLEAQRVVDLANVQRSQIAICPVFRRPHDLAAIGGQFLWRAQMVELVVERCGLGRAFAVEHGQRAEGAGFVEVSVIAIFSAFSDQPFALPEELGSTAIDGFCDATTEGVVLVGRGTATR